MTSAPSRGNRVRGYRTAARLTQAELAERAGISRAAVTAIEGQRLVPSVAAALALAKALGTTAETLFGAGETSEVTAAWAWEPGERIGPFWQAEVAGRRWRYPAESSPMWTPMPDGTGDEPSLANDSTGSQTLVVACCDPAAGLLASEFARATGQRMLVLYRSGRQALDLLHQGKVHLAGLHFSTREEPRRNSQVVRETAGDHYQLLRVAVWQEGIASAPSSRIKSVRGAVRSKLTWIGREPGSGARLCLDRLLGNRPGPRRFARNHRSVAEAVSSGWADAGVCVQLTCAEAGLRFLPVQAEAYELCLPNRLMDDPRIQALLKVVRSLRYRELLAGLAGYDTAETGDLAGVTE